MRKYADRTAVDTQYSDGYCMGEYHGYAGLDPLPEWELKARHDDYAAGYSDGLRDGLEAYRRTMEPKL